MSSNGNKDHRSFQSAGVLPLKLLQSKDAVVNGIIKPYHIQLIPTNRCNASCNWCSCANRNQKEEMAWEELQALLKYFSDLGAKAITVTGGGEPTLHPQFNELIAEAKSFDYDIGLVTNGLRWRKKSENTLPTNDLLTWIRLSVVDTESGSYDTGIIEKASSLHPDVDMGVSFTVPKNVSLKTAKEVCHVAEKTTNMTHIRFVEDIINFAPKVMDRVEEECASITGKAIFQRRANYAQGQELCFISKLKPLIDVDGYVYPCCGVQYAAGGDQQALRMPADFRMCHWRNFHEVTHFDGSACKKCYYQSYNTLLEGMSMPVEHERFL